MTATAGADMDAGTLELPPCVPAGCKVLATSTHPQRVQITVTCKEVLSTRLNGRQSEDAIRELTSKSATFYVHPEYRIPNNKTPVSAVADGLAPLARVWEWTGAESLHPFWAIQRLSRDELQNTNELPWSYHT